MSQVFLGKKIYVYRKRLSGVDKVVNLKDFSRPNKKIKCLLRTLTESKDFARQLLKFKTFSRLYEPCYQRIPYQDNRAPEAPLHSFPMKLTLHANVLNFSDNLNTIYGLSVLSLENLRKLVVIGA